MPAQQVGAETGQVLVAQGDIFFSVVRVPGPVTSPYPTSWHEAADRDLGQGIGSVVLAPREARRSSEPPMDSDATADDGRGTP